MQFTDVIIRPLLTEKGQTAMEKNNEYAFAVHPEANKVLIAKAVEKLFNVKVKSVRTQIRPGKTRRQGMVMGMTADWKRALVRLHPDNRLEFM